MTLKKRLNRIESRRGGSFAFRPSVILISSPGGEAQGAILVHGGGGTVARYGDETEEAFLARIDRLGQVKVKLTDNSR